jgi:hypothetical protein
MFISLSNNIYKLRLLHYEISKVGIKKLKDQRSMTDVLKLSSIILSHFDDNFGSFYGNMRPLCYNYLLNTRELFEIYLINNI